MIIAAPHIGRRVFLRRVIRRFLSSNSAEGKVGGALLFPGQGSQRPQMACPYVEAFPQVCKQLLDEVDEAVGSKEISRLVTDASVPADVMVRTENAQPAILVTSLLIIRILKQVFGLPLTSSDPKAIGYAMGHSLGEFSALVSAGILPLGDAVRLVSHRGKLMAKASQQYVGTEQEGAMYAVIAPKKVMQGIIEKVDEFIGLANSDPSRPRILLNIANYNAPNQIVLSGTESSIKGALQYLRKWSGQDPRAIRLNVSTAFHSPMMASVEVAMQNYVKENVKLNWPSPIKVISNFTALPFTSVQEITTSLSSSSVNSVEWEQSVEYLRDDAKVTKYLGIGPGIVMGNLVRPQLSAATTGASILPANTVDQFKNAVEFVMA